MKKMFIEIMGKTIKLNDVISNKVILVEDSVPFLVKTTLKVNTNDTPTALNAVKTYVRDLATKNQFAVVKYDTFEMPLLVKIPTTDVDNYLNEIWGEEQYRGNFELIIDAMYNKYDEEVKRCDITPSGVTFDEFASRIINEICDDVDRELIYKFVVHK